MDKFFDRRRILFVRHNNSLKLLSFLLRVTGNKHMKRFTCFLLIFHSVALIGQMGLLFRTWDKNLVIQYSPFLLITAVGISALLLPLKLGKKLQFYNYVTENSFYSLDMAGMDTKQHIIRESKQTIYFFYVNLLLISLTSALHIVKNGNEPEQFLFIKYSEETFSSQASSINFLFYVLYFIMCLYFVNELYTLVYLTQQLKFQFYILNDCISCMLGKRYKFQCELELPHNEIYQKKVFKRLKFCIKYHEMLMRNGKTMISASNGFFVLYISVFYVLWVSTLANLFWSPFVNYPRVIIQTTVLVFSGGIAAEVGERLTAETMKIHQAFANLPWYTWNMNNKKILLHTLIHVGRVLNIGPIKIFALDRNLITQVIKFIWTVSAAMIKMRDV